MQWGGFLDRLLGPLRKPRLRLIRNVLKPLAKSVLIPLRWTEAGYKKMFGPGNATLIVSDEEMNDIMKIIKSLEESSLSIKNLSEIIKNEAK